MKYDAFISFATEDRRRAVGRHTIDVVTTFKRALETHRHPESSRRFRTCTFDEDFALDTTVRKAIHRRVGECSAMFVVCGRASTSNANVQLELEIASEVLPSGRVIGVALDHSPGEVLPRFFDQDALGVDLSVGRDTNAREWRRRLLAESCKAVAHVWDLDPLCVMDRFQQERRRRRTRWLGVAALWVAICLAIVVGYNTHIGYRNTGTAGAPRGAQRERFAGFSSDSDHFVSWSEDHILIRETENASLINTLPMTSPSPHGKPWHDKELLLARHTDLFLADLETAREKRLCSFESPIRALAASSDFVAVTTDQESLFIIDGNGTIAAAPRPEVEYGRPFPPAFRERRSLRWGHLMTWSANDEWLAVGDYSGRLVIVRPHDWTFLAPNRILLYEARDTRPLSNIVFTPAGDQVLFTVGSASFVRLDLSTLAAHTEELPPMGTATQLALHPNGRVLAIGAGGRLLLFDISGGNLQLRETVVHDPTLLDGLWFSPDGTHLVASGFATGLAVYRKYLDVVGIRFPLDES